MPTSFRQIINKAVKDKRFLVVPGAHDALQRPADPEDRLRDLFHRRLSRGRRPLRRARCGLKRLWRNLRRGARYHGSLRPAGLRRRRRRLWRRQERRAHGADLRAHGGERHLDRGPAMAEALRPHGRQEGRAHRACRSQDQGGRVRAHQSGNLDPRPHRRARGLRSRRGHAPRRALYPRRRRRHFHRGAAQHRRNWRRSAKPSTCRKSAIR